jgi:hypothetical protein
LHILAYNTRLPIVGSHLGKASHQYCILGIVLSNYCVIASVLFARYHFGSENSPSANVHQAMRGVADEIIDAIGDVPLVWKDFVKAVDDHFFLWRLGSVYVTIAKSCLHSRVMRCSDFLHGVGDK